MLKGLTGVYPAVLLVKNHRYLTAQGARPANSRQCFVKCASLCIHKPLSLCSAAVPSCCIREIRTLKARLWHDCRAVLTDSEWERSSMGRGSMVRLRRFAAKLLAGKPVTVGALLDRIVLLQNHHTSMSGIIISRHCQLSMR